MLNWISLLQDKCKNIHSYFDYTYWGIKNPKCGICGYEDTTRDLTSGAEKQIIRDKGENNEQT